MGLRSLSSRNHLFLLSWSSKPCASPFLVQISHHSTSSQYHQPYNPRRHEEESRNVRVSVWWDFENCNLPVGVNVFKIAPSITAAVRANGIKGPVQITAFGDVMQLSRANQEALSSTGIYLSHIPNGGKNSADRSLLVDLMYWVSHNPPPAHLFLISGDRDFAGILHRLRMNNYNILLACTETAPSVLCSAASIMWHWHALIKGEDLKGKHFNHPPDGLSGSWYGHQKVPLIDPFSASEQSASGRTEEVSEPTSDSMLRPIPKAVVRQIRHILKFNPKGISVTDLRFELAKSNVIVDKDYYGHKKFSRFLLSLPHILQLQSGDDGHLIIRGVNVKAPEPFDCHAVSTGDHDAAEFSTLNGEDRRNNIEKPVDSLHKSSSDPSMEDSANTFIVCPSSYESRPSNNVHHSTLGNDRFLTMTNDQESESQLPPVGEKVSEPEEPLLKRIWKKLFSNDVSGSENKNIVQEISSTSGNFSVKKNEINPESGGTSVGSFKKAIADEECSKARSHEPDSFEKMPCPPSTNECMMDKKTVGSIGSCDDNSRSPGIFHWISRWWWTWRTPKFDSLSNDEDMRKTGNRSEKSGLFSNHSFWSEVEAFMDTHKGSVIISQSRTREQMARNLQKEGPLILRSLSKSDLLHFVDLLISDKKWVEEHPARLLPFKLTQSLLVGNRLSLGQSHGSNGLSSIFSGETTKSNLLKSEDGDVEKNKHTSVPHSGFSPPDVTKKHGERLRRDILADCHKLALDIVRDNPGGYNMGAFRKLFLERYGYPLEVQKLGYSKLASLLQIIPGVKVESTYIIPSDKTPSSSSLEAATTLGTEESNVSDMGPNSDSELSDSAKKDGGNDSPWEELGPISMGSNLSKVELKLTGKPIEQRGVQKHPNYEPAISDDDLSGSEEDNSCSNRQEAQTKSKNSEDSSILQILDSWYSNKEVEERKNKKGNADAVFNFVADSPKTSR